MGEAPYWPLLDNKQGLDPEMDFSPMSVWLLPVAGSVDSGSGLSDIDVIPLLVLCTFILILLLLEPSCSHTKDPVIPPDLSP